MTHYRPPDVPEDGRSRGPGRSCLLVRRSSGGGALGGGRPIVRASVTWTRARALCGTGCGCDGGRGTGRVVAVRGDEASPVNRGLLCVKGYHLPGLLSARIGCSIRSAATQAIHAYLVGRRAQTSSPHGSAMR